MDTHHLRTYLLTLLAAALLHACDSSGLTYPYAPSTGGDIEAIVLNEGLMTKLDGELSIVHKDGTAVPAAFRQVNGRPMGDVAQSLTLINGRYFVALNNSGKIEVVDPVSFRSCGTILYQQGGKPRQIVPISPTEAIVSDLNRQLVRIRTVEPYGDPIEYIPTPFWIEYMAVAADKLLALTGGGLYIFDTDNLNAQSARCIKEVKNTEGTKTARMLTDHQGRVWVLMHEQQLIDRRWVTTAVALHAIDPVQEAVVQTYHLPIVAADTARPGDVVGAINYNRTDIDPTGTWIYFNVKTRTEAGDPATGEAKADQTVQTVYRMHTGTGEFQPHKVLPGVGMMYGFAVGPEGDVYLCDCLDYTAQRGYLRKYATDGTVRSTRVGVYPSQVYFPR